jgi:hypothetical protein
MTASSRQTESFQYLSTVVLNAGQRNIRQVTFVDVTDCCRVAVLFGYIAYCTLCAEYEINHYKMY